MTTQSPLQLSQILLCTLNEDLNTRKIAEETIKKYTNENFSFFILELSKILCNEAEQIQVRQISATLIKNIINVQPYNQQWLNLNNEIRDKIKTNILSTLISPQIDIKKATALCIAGICKIELPKNQWTNIFDVLTNTSQNENIDIIKTSLITLEYIFEEINGIRINIPNSLIKNLLSIYYKILSEKKYNNDSDLINLCLKSLFAILPYIGFFLNEKEVRIKFFESIHFHIFSTNEKVRKSTLLIFGELIRLYYKYFDDFSNELTKSILNIIEKDTPDNKIYAIEIFCNIAEIEKNFDGGPGNSDFKNLRILDNNKMQIGNLLLKNLETKDFDVDEYTVSKACGYLISIMCLCCDYTFTEKMIEFYNNNILSNDAVVKFSAFNVFRAILNYKNKEKIYPIVLNSLATLSQFLLDSQTILSVRKLISLIMKNIVKEFGNLILKEEDIFNRFMDLFLRLIMNSPPEIQCIILSSISILVNKIKINENINFNINLLSKWSENYYAILLKLSQSIELFNNDHNVPMNALFTLGIFSEHTANDTKQLSYKIFKQILEMFNKTLNINSFPNDNMRKNYQEYLCGTLGSFLLNKNANEDDVRKLFDYVIQSFNQRKELYEEGISLIGNISFFLENGFSNLMKIFSPFLEIGLKSLDSPSLCFKSIICLSNIIIYNNNDFHNYLDNYMQIILNLLSNPDIDKQIKPICFNILSDLFLFCKNEIWKYFNEIMKVIGGAIEVSDIDLSNENDTDNINFFIELKEHLIETITCIFRALQDINETKQFDNYIKRIILFINNILKHEKFTSNELRLSSICLIGDFCSAYGNVIKMLLDQRLIKESIDLLCSNKENLSNMESKEMITWARNEISNVINS